MKDRINANDNPTTDHRYFIILFLAIGVLAGLIALLIFVRILSGVEDGRTHSEFLDTANCTDLKSFLEVNILKHDPSNGMISDIDAKRYAQVDQLWEVNCK